MPAQACPIYLDPYDKTQLEGYALCIQRIANIAESTHHAVTCQRWHVRFQEDQDLAARWLDAADMYAYQPVLQNTSLLQLNLPEAIFTYGAATKHFRIGTVQLYDSVPTPGTAFVCPAAGRIRHFSLHSWCTAKTGSPGLPEWRLMLNGVTIFSHTPANGNTVSTHDHETSTDYTDKTFSQNDRITARIVRAVAEGESLTLANSLMFVRLQWGNFP